VIENKKKKKMKSNQCHAPFTERLPKYLQPTYGWAMSFGKGYAKQSDLYERPAITVLIVPRLIFIPMEL